MAYTIDNNIVERISQLRAVPAVKKGYDFVEANAEQVLEQQLKLVLVEAPTFEEAERAQVFAEMLRAEGLNNVQIDRHGNTFGVRKGTGKGPTILLEGHLDTVFPKGTVKEIVRKNGRIYCPGINDDTQIGRAHV